MNKKKWTTYGILTAIILTAALAVPAMADTPAQLRAKADKIEMEQARSEATRELIKDILADADARTMMQGSKNPVTVNVHGFVQTRWSYNGGGSDEATHSFSIPRTRLIIDGDIYGMGYKVSGQWNDGGEFQLKDAYGTGNLAGLDFKFGQFKAPFMKEVLVDRVNTLAADRSIVAYTFGQGRSQGIEFGKDLGMANIKVAYTDGFDTANGAGVENGYALTARAEFDVTDWWNLGAAVSWNDLDTSDYWTYTVDTGVKMGALDLTAAYTGVNHDAGDNWAATFTAAYQCMDNLQGFVAYEYGVLDGADEDLSVATVGANYWVNDNVKWTTDFGYAMNGIASGWNLADTGWNASTDSGEYLLRTQIQIQF